MRRAANLSRALAIVGAGAVVALVAGLISYQAQQAPTAAGAGSAAESAVYLRALATPAGVAGSGSEGVFETSAEYGITSVTPIGDNGIFITDSSGKRVVNPALAELGAEPDTAESGSGPAASAEPAVEAAGEADGTLPVDPCILYDDTECPEGSLTGTVLPLSASPGVLDGDARAYARIRMLGAQKHPLLEFVQVSDFVVNVFVTRASNEAINFYFATPTGSCGVAADQLTRDTPGSVLLASSVQRLDAATVRLRNYPAEFDTQETRTYLFHPGTSVQVCAEWFASSGPSWEMENPNFVSRALITAPGLLLPRLLLAGFNKADWNNAKRSIKISVASTAGVECGALTLRAPFEEYAADATICDTSRNLPIDAANGGFNGDLVVRISVDDRDVSRTMVIPARAGECFASDCDVPETAFYGVKNCPPGRTCLRPARGEATSLVFAQSYLAVGNASVTDWAISEIGGAPRAYTMPDLPVMDTTKKWNPRPFASPPGSNTVARTSAASYELHTDRPVDYTVTLKSAGPQAFDFSRPVVERTSDECSLPGGAEQVLGGHSSGYVELRPTGLCVGYVYYATIELRDDDGRTRVYTGDTALLLEPNHSYWGRSSVLIPRSSASFEYSITITRSPATYYDVLGMPLWISDGALDGVDGAVGWGACTAQVSRYEATGAGTATVAADQIPISLMFNIFGGTSYRVDDSIRHCRAFDAMGSAAGPTISALVRFEDLTRPGGVKIEGPLLASVYSGRSWRTEPIAQVSLTIRPVGTLGGIPTVYRVE